MTLYLRTFRIQQTSVIHCYQFAERDATRAGMNLVLLDPDIAKAFPTNASVNEALRLLLQIADRQQTSSVVAD